MKKTMIPLITCAMLVGLLSTAVGQQSKMKIAVIPKGTTHIFWKSVENGARTAGKEFNVEVIWKGPLKENDRSQQIAIVEQFASENVSGIALAPLDNVALQRPVAAAMQKKIPVVIFDSALKGESGKDFVSYIATNNKKGGFLGGEHLAKLLGGKGKVVMLRYQVGSASTMEREEGFLEAIGTSKGVEVILGNRHAGATAGEAKTAAMNIVDKLKEAQGIFCPNESSTFGMLLALRQTNLVGKVKFVGFDTSPPLIDALEKGDLDALVAQDPTRMGYESVKLIAQHLQGKKVPATIDTGVRLITRENLNSPEIRKLLGTQ